MGDSVINWQAQWIWGEGEESPRNEWRCFRKTFQVPAEGWRGGRLSLTADSRYVLYVNGTRVGRGPVRSWPFELAYDTYEIEHLLRKGQQNTISVLVMHFGLSNFYYLRGRGGLLVQVESELAGQTKIELVSDASWQTSLYEGYDTRSGRMSCQQGFAERMDARVWREEWVQNTFDDHSWKAASALGVVGMEPWSKLVPRDIPYLTEERIWPIRIEALHKVKPVAWTASIDVRNQMVPDSVNHANPVGYVGYMATVVRTAKAAKGTLGLVQPSCVQACSVNGIWLEESAYIGTLPERYAEIQLKAGDNFLLFETTGVDHGRTLQFGLDCETPFELISPSSDAGSADSVFISIGPFASCVSIDHQDNLEPLQNYKGFNPFSSVGEVKEKLDADAFADFAVYEEVRSLASSSALSLYQDWIRPFPLELVSRDSVFALSVWKKEAETQPIPYSLQQAVIPNGSPAPIPWYEGADTEFIIDFGKEWSGFLEFEVDASEGTVLDFYGFEYMRDGWRQDTFDLDNTLRYTCAEGRQSYTSQVRRGFRYLMVTVRNAATAVKLHGVQMWQSNYPVAEIGRFQSSDALLNDIWQISRHTTRLCMEDTFVDCPAYEQVFWVGDSRNEALVNYYVFGATDIVERCLRLVPGSRTQTPLYVDQVPSGWSSVIPNWTFFWALASCEFYEHTGDEAFARDMWPHIRNTLEHYEQKLDERGLLFIKGWNLLDWAPIDQPNDGVVTHQNMILVKTLHSAAGLARAVGDNEEAAAYDAKATRLCAAINEHLWHQERGAYLDCIHADGRPSTVFSMQTQVIAYLCGIPEGERAEQLRSYLFAPPADFVQIGSPFMSFFYYEALAKLGGAGTDRMIMDMRQHFGQMIDYDATTCWEMYPNFKENRANPDMLTRSHCHAWSSAPGYFLGANVLGVTSADKGWRKVVVAPQPADLQWARGTVPLPREGRIDVAWRLEEDGRVMRLQVWAPRSVELEIRIPDGLDGIVERHEV
ncbi:glycoside hydrolase family 78 protein [Paenibacillus sp. HWE-109]|uniref:family 78 glycoside hydrolase catalytic domain n=1 Tax=Paenibacillus sp. HWE-109 TaxID=1306526 RepID=UPI001EE0D1C5|nr:family 78 glycoside hydrolase catalytic domain [Paenibacillus sp. HWE-109]UKS30802.1 glycoside hydrolase family 78 protein [Paenibacillus sp. HWE-109]